MSDQRRRKLNQGRAMSLGTNGRSAGKLSSASGRSDLHCLLRIENFGTIAMGRFDGQRNRADRLAEMPAQRAIAVRDIGMMRRVNRIFGRRLGSAMTIAMRALAAVMTMLGRFGAGNCGRTASCIAVVGMSQPADNNLEPLQGNRQAGNEAAVVVSQGEHAKMHYRKPAWRRQVPLHCI